MILARGIFSVASLVDLVHTCFKGGLESLVGCGSVTVAPKLHPNHISCTQHIYCTWRVAATQRLGKDGSIFALEDDASPKVRFSDFQVVVFAMIALFQFECLKGNLHLASFRDNKKPLPSEICWIVFDAVLWGAKLDCFITGCIQIARLAI